MIYGHGWFDMVLDWEATRMWLSSEFHMSHPVLHIHLGLAIFLLTGLILRRPLGSALAWLVVAGLELLNEISDFTRYYVSGWPWTATNTIEDIVNTLFWPTILVMVFRFRRHAALSKAAGNGRSPSDPDGRRASTARWRLALLSGRR